MPLLLGWVVGIAALWLWPRLPNVLLLVGATLLALLFYNRCRQAVAASVLGVCLGLCWSVWQAQAVLNQALPRHCEGELLTATVRIVGLSQPGFPRGERFMVSPEGQSGCWRKHTQWQVSTDPVLPVVPGERWQMSVRLKRVHGLVNPAGFDAEQYWHQRRVSALGRAQQAARLSEAPWSIDRWRWQFRQFWLSHYGQYAEAGTLLALMTGDRYAVTDAAWERYARTGVTHLMAISGMHITLLGVWVAWLLHAVWVRVPALAVRWPARWPASGAGLLAAWAYAALAGMELPAQRTVIMLTVVVLCQGLRTPLPTARVWLLALATVLLLDPLAVHAVGLWLSFIAVGLLLLLTKLSHDGHWWQLLLRTQWWASVGLLPLTVAIFERVSWWSLPVNLLAIPWLSWLVVPLALLGLVCVPMQPSVSDGLWTLALFTLSLAEAVLATVAQWSWGWQSLVLDSVQLLALAMFALGLLIMRSWRARSLLWLPLLVVLWPAPRPAAGHWWMTVLDVGQGLSVHVQTATHQLLFDTGAAWQPHSGSGYRVILPFLHSRQAGPLDALVLSHHDLDHTGGAPAILSQWPVSSLWASWSVQFPGLVLPPTQPCHAGLTWQWDGVQFEWLWPQPDWQFSQDNERSCVLKVSGAGLSVLITGDIGLRSESALLESSSKQLAADVLILGHHGSKSSSGTAWLDAVQPQLAVATVGYRNRFHHPHPTVLERLSARGVHVYRSDTGGALQLRSDAISSPLVLQEQRVMAPRYWRASDRNRLP